MAAHDLRITPIILAGGMGARLAPISTPTRPKPFVPLPDGESLLTKTLARLADPTRFAPPILVGRAADRFALLNHARAAGITPAAILLEPQPHNTALAIALASQYLAQRGEEGLLAILPADHWLGSTPDWLTCLEQAALTAHTRNTLCLMAVPPQCMSPEYGYMQLGAPPAGELARPVTRFWEKPADPASLGESYWNAGQFVITNRLLSQHFLQLAPDYWATAGQAIAALRVEWEFSLLAPLQTGVAAQPFDRVIVERVPAMAVALTSAWRDLGTVAAWEETTGKGVDFYRRLATRVDRPWGYFEWGKQSAHEVEKFIILYPSTRISRQRHQLRQEKWEVQSGVAHVEKNNENHVLQSGESIDIPRGSWHRLCNRGDKLLIIREIQSGMPDEMDIERSEDDYGRV